MNLISLTPIDLALAALLIVLLAITSWMLHLGIAKQLLIAAVRTVIQLLLIGLVLKLVFEQVSLLIMSAIALVMLLAAGREVVARQTHRFTGPWGFFMGTGAMFLSSFVVTLFALLVVIGNDPWYLPQYAIPLLGMMLGNTMNGVTLGLAALTRTAWQQRAIIETRLMLGQTWQQAITDIRRDSIRIGMIPIINAMAAAGIVSLPGMMTGQILAGTPPVEAVKYQILIMFLVTAGTGFGTVIVVNTAARRLFDQRQRLRLDRLSRVKE